MSTVFQPLGFIHLPYEVYSYGAVKWLVLEMVVKIVVLTSHVALINFQNCLLQNYEEV